MKHTVVFVILQYIIGFAFGITGMFLLPEKDSWSLGTSILYTLLFGFACMLVGVSLVGYFHLRVKRVTHRFLIAFILSLTGAVLFGLLSVLLENYLPQEFSFLSLIFPLTGAVFGFNLIATTASRKVDG